MQIKLTFNKLFIKTLIVNYRKNTLQKIPRFHHYNLGKYIMCASTFFFISHKSKKQKRSYVSIKFKGKLNIPAFVVTSIDSTACLPPAFNDMPSF